jgi:hypothetical protein
MKNWTTKQGGSMKMYATIRDSKCGSFYPSLDAAKAEASKLAKKYNQAVHIVGILGQAVPTVTIEFDMEEE